MENFKVQNEWEIRAHDKTVWTAQVSENRIDRIWFFHRDREINQKNSSSAGQTPKFRRRGLQIRPINPKKAAIRPLESA